jgi:polyhydroxyalkanoate synthesis regulator protein
MATLLANSVINIVRSFSQEDMEAFIEEFSKLQQPVSKCKPKKIKKYDPEQILKELQMENHTKRHPSAR